VVKARLILLILLRLLLLWCCMCPANFTAIVVLRVSCKLRCLHDSEMVALVGAHCLGRCHSDRSGYVGPWTNAPTTFSNLYFQELVNNKWWVPGLWKRIQISCQIIRHWSLLCLLLDHPWVCG